MINELQKILNIPETGEYDDFTEAAVRNFQLKNSLSVTGIVDNETKELLFPKTFEGFISTDLSEPHQTDVPDKISLAIKNRPIKRKDPKGQENYFERSPKESLFLHFTAGWDNPYSVIKDWENDTRGPIATQFVIGGVHGQTLATQFDGEIVQCMSYENYAWHLGIGNTSVHRNSIGIEMCCLGPLTKRVGDYFMWDNKRVRPEIIIDLKREFRGHQYFQRLSENQLKSLDFLIRKIGKETGIDITKGMKERLKTMDPWKAFDYDPSVVSGKDKGLFCHSNVSPKNKYGNYEKWDWFPQEELIDLINSL